MAQIWISSEWMPEDINGKKVEFDVPARTGEGSKGIGVFKVVELRDGSRQISILAATPIGSVSVRGTTHDIPFGAWDQIRLTGNPEVPYRLFYKKQ